MAIRNTTHVLKNSNIVNRPLPSSLLQGEPIVNTADGIVFFSGITTSTSEWTPAGTGTTANFFEVGSNLYDLRLRNQITQYQGQSGGSLSGKFLSGTTNGFVLADIADIANTSDSYITGATWSPNTLTLKHNLNRPDVNVTIDSFNNVSLYGTSNVNGDLNVTGITNLNGLSYYNNTASSSNEIVNYGLLTSFTQTNDVYVTGNTYNGSTDSSNVVTYDLLYHGSPISGPYSLNGEDTYTTGGTYDNNTALITFNRNDGSSYNVDLSSLDLNDTFVTGGTVTSLGDLELFRNDNVTVTIPKVTYWTSGSTGSFAIKAINNSGLDSTGDRAVSWGNQTLASGNDSTAWGVQTSATTLGSTASGYQTLASGNYSHAEGYLTKATQNGSHAEGINTTASGYYSHSEGNNTTASGDYSTASGYYSVSSGKVSTASGAYTTASGYASHAEGTQTMASGGGSHSEGQQTLASGSYSHAEGNQTTSTGNYSHAEGIQTTSSGYYSHSEGNNTTSMGQGSHSEGKGTISSGNYSHAEGVAKGGVLTASGYGSHAEGFNSTASGIYSHAEGGITIASGKGSHAEGRGTTSSGDYSHSQGSGSISQGNYSFASGINSIASVSGTFIHSNNSLVNGTRSVVLGGQNITGSTNDTVYVPYLNLNYVPTLNNSNTQILSRNSSTGQVEYTALSAFTSLDTFVTGFTYNPSNNTFTLSQNQGQPNITTSINAVSGLTVSNLTAGRVVYVGTGGLLTDESGFEYNDGTNLLTVGNINVTNASGTTANIGQGGLVIGSGGSYTSPGVGSLTVHGDLTVFGDTTTISTSELYVEDPQITLNYNPTGNTSSTSIASGIRIQDGDGLGNDVLYTIAQMNTFTGGDVTEYTGSNGYTNRGFMTELNDIIIRNTNSNNGAPDGFRVLAEGDILDGGVY